MIDTNPLAELPPFKFNRLLHGKLSDDEQRAELYRQLHDERRLQVFRSPADAHAGSGTTPLFNQQVVLLSERAHVLQALTDDHHFSNAPYRTLGSGTFMLGLDGMAHAEQLGFARRALRFSPAEIQVLAALAWSAARVVPLQTRRFDAALLAEQVALRYAALLFGFPLSEHPYLEAAMRSGYQQLVYQIIGRHFSLDLALEPRAKAAGGALLQHTVDLLNRYAAGEVPDDLGELRRAPGLAEFRPVCQRVAEDPGEQSATELAVIVCGLIAGTIGNVQACVAIALDAIVSAPVGAAPRPGLRPTGSIDSPLGDVGRACRCAR